MAIRIRLGDYERVTDDVLGREAIGYFPRMTEGEALEAGRGVWRLDMRIIISVAAIHTTVVMLQFAEV
jgi:hypothetical protein